MKKVLITGSSQGIGKKIAEVLNNSGYEVFLCARNQKKLEKTAKELGLSKSHYLSIDLTSENAVEKIFDYFKDIDILVNNAGQYVYSPIENTKEEDIKNLLKLNVKTPFLMSQRAVKIMKQKKWGRIINIGSISGSVGEANASLYSMCKASLIGLSKALALELSTYKITVNTICPGWVDTNLTNDALNEDEIAETLEMIPQRRFIEPVEIADLVKYLISENAKGLTGQTINLCAGLSLG